MQDSLALSRADYQPMAIGLDLLGAVPATDNAKVVQEGVHDWSDLYDTLDGNPAVQAAVAARVIRLYEPRLQRLGLTPRPDEAPTDTLLRPTLISILGKFKDPVVVGEARRLFSAWQQDSNAIPGSLKQTWLELIARNADPATWEIIHRKAQEAAGAVERTDLYQLLGRTTDEALAQRALDLSLTKEPGATVSSGIITSVAVLHPRLATDFMLAHLPQINQLVDSSGRSRFIQRLAGGSSDPALIPTLERYASANLAPSDRKPVEQAIGRIRFRAAQAPRIKTETAAWLAAHPV
jgi:aminopeptidase N